MRWLLIVGLILILLIGAAAVFLFASSGVEVADLLGGQPTPTRAAPAPTTPPEPQAPTPTPTPRVNLVPVVVARVDLPIGSRITRDLVAVEMRPETNVAIRAGYTFDDPAEVVGRMVGRDIGRGQAILEAMLALSPTDVAAFGSDLALQLDQGRVAVAFPINRYTGVAYALRPGDRVDVLMSLALMDVDIEFQSRLPNQQAQVNEAALLAGSAFLFDPTAQGRLEVIPGLNLVGLVAPGAGEEPIPRYVTQLTLQQVEVIWMGTWRDPLEVERAREAELMAARATAQAVQFANPDQPSPVVVPTPQGRPIQPDIIILSLTAQDALVLKWSLESGVRIDLALRAQGDQQAFVTTSVSLPQALEQSGLTIPEPGPFNLEPPVEEVPPPSVPDQP